jgi:hypothetical protein
VRDVTHGEDAGQAWAGSTPQALAALRNALLRLLWVTGWTTVAGPAPLRAYPRRALAFLGAHPARF